jgi:hypothetical protein
MSHTKNSGRSRFIFARRRRWKSSVKDLYLKIHKAKLKPAAINIDFLVCNILYLGQKVLHTGKSGECNSTYTAKTKITHISYPSCSCCDDLQLG